MLKRAYNDMVDRHEWLPVMLLLLMGFVLRLWALGALPYGLNQDEASAGYEAWALLNYGVDRCGDSWPVLFTSWGSGQNVLMSYFAMPFIAMLGLTETAVRLPNAISGCMSLIVFWLFARRCRGRRFALCALLILAVNPWHIMMSRWALESNQLPFFLLLGVYLTSLAPEHKWALVGAAISFGLSPYAYGTAFFFLPIFLICAVIWLRRDLELKSFLCALLLFILIALPIALCQLLNMLDMTGVSFFGLTLPQLTEGRQAATSVFGGGGYAAAEENFRRFLRLLWTQSDGLSFNALPLKYGGIFYAFGLPTAIIGIAAALSKRKDVPAERPMLIALCCALVCAFLIDCNINRINMIWLPLIYFSALGCYIVLCKLKSLAAPAFIAIVCCMLLFTAKYGENSGAKGNGLFFPGLGEAIAYCEESGAEDIYITDYVNQPYIFALFYSQTSPRSFAETAVYPYPNAAFRPVRSFAGYRFGGEAEADAELNILHRSETASREVLASFGHYCVCK